MTEQSPKSQRPQPDFAAAIVMLRSALGRQWSVRWHGTSPHTGAHVSLSVGDHQPVLLQLLPEGAPQPSGATNFVWVVSRSDRLQRDHWRNRGLQFIDLSGAVRIAQGPLHLDREGLPPVRPARDARVPADPFADKSSMVLRVLLSQRDTSRLWGLRELAKVADVSLATTSDVIRTLADRGLVRVQRLGRSVEISVADPRRVFDAWTRAYDGGLNRGVLLAAPVGDPATFLPRLAGALTAALPEGNMWALTMQAGASLVAPWGTWSTIHAYIDVRSLPRATGLRGVVDRIGWTPSTTGSVMLLVPFHANSAWYGRRLVQGIPVVSDLQLALDLWHHPNRGREQAERILDGAFGASPV